MCEPKNSYGYNDINGFLPDYFAGSVFLDRNLCIKRYSPSVTKEINLLDYHVGRPINHITHNFENENLAQNAIRVLNSLVSIENEVRSIYGDWYLLRYSPSYEFENRVNGITISLVNVTRFKKTHNKFYQLSQAVEQSSAMVMITNIDGKIEYVNPRFTEVTGYTSEEITEGILVY
jgi:two-component system CheB/CheR fusion protein